MKEGNKQRDISSMLHISIGIVPYWKKDLTSSLEKLNIKPEKILFDNRGQFREQWKSWCISRGIEPKFTHPYYPQDKGKVERTIRNITEELIAHLSHFAMFFGKFEEYRIWFNEKRYHGGVNDSPSNLYGC